MTFKNAIPIKTHTQTHLINTCSNKFDATLGFKNICKSKNCFRKSVDMMHIIIIIHYKHWLYDSTSPIWLYALGQHYREDYCFLTSVFDITSLWNVTWPHQESTRIAFSFLYKCGVNVNSGIKMSQKYDHLMICLQQRRYCRSRIHKITKGLYFFFFPTPLQSLTCKIKIYKSRLNHVVFLKIDERDKLLKVNILSDAEWLFWSDTKRDMQQK